MILVPFGLERDFDDLVPYICRIKGEEAVIVRLCCADPSLIVESEV